MRIASQRFYSSEVDRETRVIVQRQSGGIATLQMSSGPVNALSSNLCSDLLSTIQELEEVRHNRMRTHHFH